MQLTCFFIFILLLKKRTTGLFDHTASIHKDSDWKQEKFEQQRVAALDLFDKEMVEQSRAAQSLDHVIRMVLKKLGTSDDPENLIWTRIYKNQITHSRANSNWFSKETRIGVVDEVGMENIRLKSKGGRAFKLFPAMSSSTLLYGGTLCGKLGWEVNCVQFVVPFEQVLAASSLEILKEEKSWRPHNDKNGKVTGATKRREEIIVNAMRVWKGETVVELSAEENAMNRGDDGHEFYFQVFLSALSTNSLDKPGKCEVLQDLQTPEQNIQKPGQTKGSCGADGNTKNFCRLPRRLFGTGGFAQQMQEKSIEEDGLIYDGGKTCDGVGKLQEKQELDSQWYYAQRFVDPSSCQDLVVEGAPLVTAFKSLTPTAGKPRKSFKDLRHLVKGGGSGFGMVAKLKMAAAAAEGDKDSETTKEETQDIVKK